MIFGVWNPEKIWHQKLIHLPTLPVYCNRFTLGNPKKSFFNSIIHTDFRLLRYHRREKTATVVLQLICLLTVVTASYYLSSPILWSVFLSLWSVIFKANYANPHPALFRVTNIWRNATLPAVRCKSFTFYKVVRWHFSGLVGKGVTVCFFLRYINNLKYVWIILLRMTLLEFPR